jgi:hypothetical protein
LKQGAWRKVVNELIDLLRAKGLDETAPVWTEINYSVVANSPTRDGVV